MVGAPARGVTLSANSRDHWCSTAMGHTTSVPPGTRSSPTGAASPGRVQVTSTVAPENVGSRSTAADALPVFTGAALEVAG